ncbi:MAG: 50S ribosomal protein L4 [Candidatus Omnitrophota bacterium]|jgi:large subunit ribosomal protein L4
MEAITLPIYNTEGKEVDQLKLDPQVFDGTINSAAIYQAVNAYRANQRKGLAATKTRGEVSGGGKKPWRQKGTGRARVGSIRSPLWRHGGVIFGPHPRDFSYRLPAKIKTLALRSSLNAKVKENNFIILDHLTLETPKTKDAVKVFSNLKIVKTKDGACAALLLLDKPGAQLKLALRNLKFLHFNQAQDTQAYEVLASRRLIITKPALEILIKRLKKS